MKNSIQKIAVIGNGAWGTTLADYLSRKPFEVTLWGAFSDDVAQMQKARANSKFLPGVEFHPDLKLTDNLDEAIPEADLVVMAVPSEYAVGVLKKMKKFDYSKKAVLSVIKGIQPESLQRMSQVIYHQLDYIPLAVLSGPTIAIEVAKGIPSSAVIASKDATLSQKLQKVFNSDTFRIYTNTDIAGVELGGSLKNVIALACGVCDGLGFGTNTKAALLSRGLAEISRLGKAMGAKSKTFSGLTGLGDLCTTCFSPESRNRQVGERLGRGESIDEIRKNMSAVAEGVVTVQAVCKLSDLYETPMPISREVYHIIYDHKNPLEAVQGLMNRKAKAE